MHTFVGTTLGYFVHLDKVDIENCQDNQPVFIEDIAICLSKKNRFNDHGTHFWSVSDHSCMVAALFLIDKLYPFDGKRRDHDREGIKREIDKDPCAFFDELLYHFVHDFTEGYIGDCPSPFKRTIPEFSEAEDLLFEKCILPRIGLMADRVTPEMKTRLKKVDSLCGILEMSLFFPQWHTVNDKIIAKVKENDPWAFTLLDLTLSLVKELSTVPHIYYERGSEETMLELANFMLDRVCIHFENPNHFDSERPFSTLMKYCTELPIFLRQDCDLVTEHVQTIMQKFKHGSFSNRWQNFEQFYNSFVTICGLRELSYKLKENYAQAD